jgi:hypothetical protein
MQADQAIMDTLATQVGRPQAWDVAPLLLFVHVAGSVVTLTPAPVRAEMWDMPEGPAQGLELFAHAIPEVRPGNPRGVAGELHAVAFMNEAYGVMDVSLDDHHAWRRVQKMSGERRLYRHPEAEEIRIIVAIARDGIVYQATHGRLSGETAVLIIRPDSGDEPAGVVVEALDMLLFKLTGTPRPKRPDTRMPTTGDMN